MEGMVSTFWRDRPTFVTGATGLVGGWLVRRMVESGADVICLVRDWVPQCELVRARLIEQVKIVRGDVRDQALLERVLGEYEIDTVIHLAAQTIVPIANRNPTSTFETNIGGTWTVLEGCRRSPTVKQIVVASSDKAYGDHETLPYDEDTPLRGRHPYDVSKSCAVDSPSLCGYLWFAGSNQPLWEFLRWWRLELESYRAWNDPLSSTRTTTNYPLRWTLCA